MVSVLFKRYISTHTDSDIEEVAFATGRRPRPYLRSYETPDRQRTERPILREVPKARPIISNKENTRSTMTMAEYSRKLDEAVAMCKRRK